ncbi:PRC-barrel domain-containing protein [candidate division FCPU426 bacterium]|nr:PRC-barrel domain-containing protein [candidate division FCPU426 bacterium]
MRSWLKDIKGMWVATYTEGIMVGTVNGIYLDPATKSVVGLILRTGTPLAGADVWVDIKDVKKIGVDLIFLPNEHSISKGEQRGKRLAQLVGMPVSSKDGKALGNLADIEVDRDTWQITELGLSGNQSVAVDIQEMVLGEDLILVQNNAAAVLRSAGKHMENIVESVLGKDFFKSTTDAVKRALRGNEADLTQKGGEVQPEEKPSEPDEQK